MRFVRPLLPRCILFACLFAATDLPPMSAQSRASEPVNYLELTFGVTGTSTSADGTDVIVFNDRFSGRIAVRSQREPGGVTWYPRELSMRVIGRVEQTERRTAHYTGEGDTKAIERSVDTYVGNVECEVRLANAFVRLCPADQRYDIEFTVMADMASTQDVVLQRQVTETEGAPSLGGGRRSQKEDRAPLDMGPGQMSLSWGYYSLPVKVKDLPLNQTTGSLSGRARIPMPPPARWKGSWDLAVDASWRLGVALTPVELEVTIPNYANWRPEGSIPTPKEPGNHLVARATLKSPIGKPELLPRIESLRFQLLDASREPGICLNWPLGANDRDLDLRLAPSDHGGGQLSKEDQVLEVGSTSRDEQGQRYAEAKINSFDFGGRATLRVTAKLDDGREVEGVLKGPDGAQTLIRLPKMALADWIADAWRKEHQVMNHTSEDDNEKVDGQQYNGDGFTLYEEYRGWVMAGKHLMGDPTRKDFFVLNERGADVRNGIALFERLSKLRVHSKLRFGKELSPEIRCVNANHRDAPHRVQQHAVHIWREHGPGGGFTVPVDGAGTGRAFRPRYVRYVMMEFSEVGRGIGVFSVAKGLGFSLSQRDAESAWDRAVAHELLHSVGVEHHGETQRRRVEAYFQGPENPINPSGRPRFVSDPSLQWDWYSEKSHGRDAWPWTDDRGDTITLLWEDTRKPLWEDFIAQYNQRLAQARADAAQYYQADFERATKEMASTGKSAKFWQDYSAETNSSSIGTRLIWHNDPNSTDSGDDLCVMKYYFANAYRIKGQANAYYVIRPGAVRAGRSICHASAGTGGNAASHQPQSRFGDAKSGRGNCFFHICPNDAIPPRIIN